MNLPEEICRDGLRLRPLRVSDAREVFEGWTRHPEMSKYIQWKAHRALAETEAFLKECEELHDSGKKGFYLVSMRDTQASAGVLSLKPESAKTAMIGFLIFPAFQKQGLAVKAVAAALRWLLEQPEMKRVFALCDVDNLASQKVMEKAGMKREGMLPRHGIHPNISDEPRDVYLYAVEKP